VADGNLEAVERNQDIYILEVKVVLDGLKHPAP